MDANAPETPTVVPVVQVRLRRPRTARLLGISAVMFAALTIDSAASTGHWLSTFLCLMGTMVSLALAVWFGLGRQLKGAVSVDARDLRVGSLRFARAGVSEGMAIPSALSRAQLTLRDGSVVEATVASLEEADALLDHVSLEPGQRAMRFPARSIWKQAAGAVGGSMVGGYIGFYLGLILAASAGVPYVIVLAAPLAAVFAAMGWVSTRPIEIRVGTDGITLRGAFKTRFIPFADLSGVGENSGDPMLYFRDGHTEVIWNCAVSNRPELLSALQHRVNGALATNAEHDGLMARAAVLARLGRPLATWQTEIARAVDPTQGYRSTGLSRSDAEAVLDDARSPVDHRIGAAMALRSLDAAEASTRVRIAAAGCASPELRAALEDAGDGTLDEATVARAVAAVEKGRGWT